MLIDYEKSKTVKAIFWHHSYFEAILNNQIYLLILEQLEFKPIL